MNIKTIDIINERRTVFIQYGFFQFVNVVVGELDFLRVHFFDVISADISRYFVHRNGYVR